jgi:hypothetical protein
MSITFSNQKRLLKKRVNTNPECIFPNEALATGQIIGLAALTKNKG